MKYRIKVRRGILISLVGLLLLSTVSVWWAGESAGRASVRSLSNRLMDQVRDGVRERVKRDLQPAMALAQNNARLIATGVFDVTPDDAEHLLGLLESQARQFPLDGFYVGTADGTFLMVKRTPEGLRRQMVVPATRTQLWTWTDATGALQTRHDEYDDRAKRMVPAERAWYQAAMKDRLVWTGIYEFKSDGALGITAAVALQERATPLEALFKISQRADLAAIAPELHAALAAEPDQPLVKLADPEVQRKLRAAIMADGDPEEAGGGDSIVYDADVVALRAIAERYHPQIEPWLYAVVGIDVRITSLSEFLQKIEVSKSGKAFLLDQDSRLVAHPQMSTAGGRGDGTSLLAPASQSSDPVVVGAVAQITDGSQSEAITVDGARWQVMLSPLDLGEGFPRFRIGVAVPEEDFMSEITANQVRTAIIALVAVGVGILLAVWITRGIAQPILQLEEAMSRVKQMDLNVNTDIETGYIEIEQMVHSFDAMVKGLHSFSRYVPRDVVLDLIATGTAAELGGEERELSIFFSDIVGFTGLAETMPAGDLLQQLGEYFEDVTEVLREREGTLDKFIGDAVMALWNAPKEDPQHRLHAALAAVEIQKVIGQANERWTAEGKPALHTRIGLATAQVVVGNVGSRHRLNYTAVGDGVNLASRLEGANKYYGTRIIAADPLVTGLPEKRIVTQPLDILAVKGRARGVRIHEVIGLYGEVAQSRLDAAGLYTEAFERYLARDFAAAKAKFEAVLKAIPGYQPAVMFSARCDHFTDEPPPANWDGVFALDQK